MTRSEEINRASIDITEECRRTGDWENGFYYGAQWADAHPKNPWVTDRMPEIKENGWSDPVLLQVDGQFLKVSRYCRREDGTTYWNGVDDWNGEEVDAWMPIPELNN